MNPLNPKKLLLTKWTAVTPVAKQKHFLVSRVIQPALDEDQIELVEIESVFSNATQIIPWRELQNDSVWRQGAVCRADKWIVPTLCNYRPYLGP
jgi:tryptophan-rich hypothetical protein